MIKSSQAVKDIPSLVLASASPRRQELLGAMGCAFTVQSADIDETRLIDEAAGDYVKRLAREKAVTVASVLNHCSAKRNIAVLGADTIVVQGDIIFTKPKDLQHAMQIWRSLANAKHSVMSAVSLVYSDTVDVRMVTSRVEFGSINEAQMRHYWQSGEPQDKAGAYAIQGLASAWVKLIHGSYSNVVGLPLRETNQLLKTIGHNWL